MRSRTLASTVAAGLLFVGTLGTLDTAAGSTADDAVGQTEVVEVAVHQDQTAVPRSTYLLEDADGDLTALAQSRGRELWAEQAEVEAAEETDEAAYPAPHRVYIAVLDGQGAVGSDASIEARVDDALDFWVTESDGVISAFSRPAATQHFTSSSPCSATQVSNLWADAAAKFPGVSFSSSSGGNHLVVVTSSDAGRNCAFGLGTVGNNGLASGGRIVVQDHPAMLEALAHEIGHNVSLRHAEGEVCRSSCTVTEYDNDYDVMGYSGTRQPPALSTSERSQLGVVDDGEVATVTLPSGQSSATSTFTLAARGGTPSAGLRGLRVTEPVSGRTLFVEWRDGQGRDAGTRYSLDTRSSSDSFAPGVTVERLQSDGVAADLLSRVVDSRVHRSVRAGETFVKDGFGLRVDAIDADSADVTVVVATTTPAFGGGTPPTTTTTPVTTTPPPTTTTTPVTTVVPAPKIAVSIDGLRISGKARAGGVLRAQAGLTPASAQVAWAWFVDGKRVRGADDPRLKVRRGWVGDTVVVQAVATFEGSTDTARSGSVKVARPVGKVRR